LYVCPLYWRSYYYWKKKKKKKFFTCDVCFLLIRRYRETEQNGTLKIKVVKTISE